MPGGLALITVPGPEQEARAVAVPLGLPADPGRCDQVPCPRVRPPEKPAAYLPVQTGQLRHAGRRNGCACAHKSPSPDPNRDLALVRRCVCSRTRDGRRVGGKLSPGDPQGKGAGSNQVLIPLEVRGDDRLEGLGVVVSHRHSVTATAPKPRPPSAGAFVTPAGRRGVPAFPAAASGC